MENTGKQEANRFAVRSSNDFSRIFWSVGLVNLDVDVLFSSVLLYRHVSVMKCATAATGLSSCRFAANLEKGVTQKEDISVTCHLPLQSF